MAARTRTQLQWISAGPGAGEDDCFAPAPGQLEHGQDFLLIGQLAFGSRVDRWKWSGFRASRAPHGFEGVCASREAAVRAAELAYFGD